MSEATKAAYLTDTNISNLQNGQRLIYDGTDWVNTSQQDISNLIELSDLSATNVAASGIGNLAYDSSTGKFTHTPPDVTSLISATNVAASGIGNLDYDSSTGKFTYTPPKQTVANLTDTELSPLQSGQRLIYNGAKWVNVAPIFASVKLPNVLQLGGVLDGFVKEVDIGINVLDGANLFRITVAGWYSLGFTFNYAGGAFGTGANYEADFYIYLNGNSHQNIKNIHNEAAAGSFGGSYLIQLSLNDVISFRMSFGDGAGSFFDLVVNGFASLVKVD